MMRVCFQIVGEALGTGTDWNVTLLLRFANTLLAYFVSRSSFIHANNALGAMGVYRGSTAAAA
jgi:hypothetical protein